MANVPPPGRPVGPRDQSTRWPWVALVIGLIVVLAAIGFFFFNRSQTVNIGVGGTPSVSPVARAGAASPSPPPTLVPPTPPTSAALAPSAPPVPAPTQTPASTPAPTPAPTPPPAPTQPPPTPAPTQVAAPPAAAGATTAPTTPQAGAAATPGTPTPSGTSTPATTASPTPFGGQVANAGGLGNTRSDLDAAYGQPTGQTPDRLVVYRKDTFEYHVGFAPETNGRAALIVQLPQQAPQPLSLEQAQAEAHKLLPKDAQPPNPTPETSDQFVVERYTSQTLAQALPASLFTAANGQPGQFLIVYVKDQQNRITRTILGPGNNPNALINQGR